MSVSEQNPEPGAQMTRGQRRLLALVYIMGGVLIVLFVGVVLGFVWQMAKLQS
jgi:hypothetical protein